MEAEHQFQCPYCWSQISMILDLSVSDQSYVEDCEVCCQPIQVQYESVGAELVSFSASSLGG